MGKLETSERLSAGGDRAGRAPWIEGAALAALILVILTLGGEAVRASYHGYLHTTLGETVLREGLTPENPYYAGAPLRYYTLYPTLAVLVGKLGMGPLWAFALFNVLAALLLGPALDAVGRAFQVGWLARRAAFLTVVLGFNAIGWIGYLTGDHAEFGRAPLYVLKAMTFVPQLPELGWDTRLQAFLPKFLNVSSFAFAIPFGLWALAEAARIGTAGQRAAWRCVPFAFAVLAINPLVGMFTGIFMTAAVLPALAKGGVLRRLEWPLAGGLSLALAIPFLLPLSNPAPDGMPLLVLGAQHGNAVSNFFGPLLLVWIPGLIGLRLIGGTAAWKLAAPSALIALLALFVPLEWGNEYKYPRLLGIVWAVPVGCWAANWIQAGGWKRWVPIALVAIALPTTVITVVAYLAWGDDAAELPLHTKDGVLAVNREAVENPVPKGILEAEAAADPDAVLLMHPLAPGMSVPLGLVQGHPLAPLLHHPIVVDTPHFHNDRHRDLLERIDMGYAVWHGQTSGIGGRQPVPFLPHDALHRLREMVADRPMLVLSANMQDFNRMIRAAGAKSIHREAAYQLWLLPPLKDG